MIKLYGICVQPFYCCVIEFMDKGSIYDLIHQQRVHFTLDQALQIFKEIAEGMKTIHSMKPPVIHRDLTTRNVLMGSDGHIKIADFGIARDKDISGPQVMSPIGQMRYRAPEITLKLPYGKRVDVFNFGTVMWEVLTGQKPFENIERDAECAKLVAQAGKRLPIPTHLPVKLQHLIQICWNSDPKKRPSFKEIVAIVDTIIAEEKMQLLLEEQLQQLHSKEKDAEVEIRAGTAENVLVNGDVNVNANGDAHDTSDNLVKKKVEEETEEDEEEEVVLNMQNKIRSKPDLVRK